MTGGEKKNQTSTSHHRHQQQQPEGRQTLHSLEEYALCYALQLFNRVRLPEQGALGNTPGLACDDEEEEVTHCHSTADFVYAALRLSRVHVGGCDVCVVDLLYRSAPTTAVRSPPWTLMEMVWQTTSWWLLPCSSAVAGRKAKCTSTA